jgi:16S rRNA G966 N2-methylase RsmD
MPKNTLLIHDTRTVGVITATVLARVLSRRSDDGTTGGTVHALFGRELTLSVRKFWGNARSLINSKLQEHPCETVILCCMGFDDLNIAACQETLKWLKSRAELIIYSHKWPDGYARAEFEVLVSPHAIVEKYIGYIEPIEWELLRTSLIVARETDREFANDTDLVFAEQLAKNIWPSGADPDVEEKHWDRLTKNLSDVINKIKAGKGDGDRPHAKRTDRHTHFRVYDLEEYPPVSIEKTLEAESADPTFPSPGIAIGIVNRDGNDSQAYLLRPWQQRKHLPSIAHLIKTYGETYGMRDWVGSQDAMHVRMPPEQRETLQGQLMEFCSRVATLRFGSRQPHAWAAQFIHKQATEVLEKIDLFKTFVGPENGHLFFDPEGTQIILSQSNRFHTSTTQTLTLRLVVSTPEAAAFLFGHGGYNFTKLETSLDGALAAIARIPSLWLGVAVVPSKLRIDADLRPSLENIGKAFEQLKEFAPLMIGDAVKSGVVKSGSVIARALNEVDAPLVVFRGSETIGPSVQYEILSHSIVNALHQELERKVDVLELFSGSGYCSRKLTKPEGMARIVCVDASVDAKTALLQQTSDDVIWLRTLVDQVLTPDGIYYRSYDIILMDPPHGMILDILFGGKAEGSVAARASKLAHGLVIYVGHDSQATRSQAVARALKQWYQQVTEWRVGSERLVSAGRSLSIDGGAWEYDSVLAEAYGYAIKGAEKFDPHWPVEIVESY